MKKVALKTSKKSSLFARLFTIKSLMMISPAAREAYNSHGDFC